MPDNKFVISILIIAIFWLASYVVTFIINIVEKLVSKTSSTLDDELIEASKLPIRYLAILLGFYYAANYAEFSFDMKGFGVDDVFYVLIVLLVSFTLARLLKVFFGWYTEKGDAALGKQYINKTVFIFVQKVINFGVYVLAILTIFGRFDINIGPMIAGLGVAGLAIALGLKTTLENLFAALFLIMDRSVNIGDYIQLEDGTKAFIEDISWRTVRIRTVDDNTIIVPNSVFVGQNISSYDFPESPLRSSVLVGVAYDSDLELVEKVAIQTAQKVLNDEKVEIKEYQPRVRFREFGPSSINLSVLFKVDQATDEGRIKHSLIKEIKKSFEENNIEIPFPQIVVSQKK